MKKYISEDTRKSHNHESQLSKGTKGTRNKEKKKTPQTIDMKLQAHKQRRTAMEEPLWNGQKVTTWGLKLVLFAPFTLTQFQITNICSVRKGVRYLICETSHWSAYNQNHCDETKQKAQRQSEAKTQENHKQELDEPDRT